MSEGYMEFDSTSLEKIPKQLPKEGKNLKEKQILIESIFKEFNIIELKAKYRLNKLLVAHTIDKKNPKYKY
ncbi:MAG TPA: hypothetical protein ENK99_01680 [Campylobacterales bacterium]|nr:hypothetical protein [Campylobacterales bacterium]